MQMCYLNLVEAFWHGKYSAIFFSLKFVDNFVNNVMSEIGTILLVCAGHHIVRQEVFPSNKRIDPDAKQFSDVIANSQRHKRYEVTEMLAFQDC